MADVNGWIKLHRKLLDNPIIMKDSDHLAVWMYLLLNATHAEYPALFRGKRIMLKPGQLITGRKSIAESLKSVSESKVTRVLKLFESEHQIEQQTSNKNRLISIVNWDFYQASEQQNETQVNNNRTTSEQQVNTNKNVKNNKNGKNERKKESVEATRTLFEKHLPDYNIPDALKSKMGEWVTYKMERKEPYQEQGMKSLLRQIETNASKYGSQKLCDLIDECMANGWKGIIFDKLKPKPGSNAPVRTEVVPSWMKKEGKGYERQNYDFEELEREFDMSRPENNPKSIENDPELAARAERLKEKLGGK